MVLIPSLAWAQPSSIPRADFWDTDGDVWAVVVTNGIAYVGGRFGAVISGYPVSEAGFDLTSGLAQPDFPPANDTINTAISDGSGGWFIGGSFTTVGGLPKKNLVHILPDRSVDPQWKLEPDGVVFRLALFANTLYVGGNFTTIAGRTRQNLASFDLALGRLEDWHPDPIYRPSTLRGIAALVVTDEAVYISGLFDLIDGQDRRFLAALDRRTGKPTAWNPDIDRPPAVILPYGNKVLVGGPFKTIDGQPRNYLASLDRDSGRVTPWNPECDAIVYELQVSCDKLYVGGLFQQIGGQARSGIAALDLDSGEATSWNPQANGDVRTMARVGGTLFVGGQFERIGGQDRLHLAALDLESGLATSWSPQGACPIVNGLAINGRFLYAGGAYGGGGIKLRHHLAAFDVATGLPTPWNPQVEGDVVVGLAVSGNTVYVGGKFTAIGGQARTNIAAIETVTGRATPWNPGADDSVRAFAIAGDLVYAGGFFTRIGGQLRNGLAALDARTGLATYWDPDSDGSVSTITLAGSVLYAGGHFSRIGGVAQHNLAALDTLFGSAYFWAPEPNNDVFVSALAGSVLYVAGKFNRIGGFPIAGVAAVDASSGDIFNWDAQADNAVTAMSLSPEGLYVGGTFLHIGGQARNRLALLNPITANALPWHLDTGSDFSQVLALVPADGTLYVGGLLAQIGGVSKLGLAVLPPIDLPKITLQPQGQTIDLGAAATLFVAATGKGPLTYQWRFNGTNLPGTTGTNLVIANAKISDSGIYTVVVENSLGQVISANAQITVVQPPALVGQPSSQAVAPGANVTLSVAAIGNPPPIYQWRRNGVNMPGATAATLVFTNAQPFDGGIYSVVVLNGGGTAISGEAELEVQAPVIGFKDNFLNLVPVSTSNGVGRGQNSDATDEAGEPQIARKVGHRSVWYGWRAPASGIARFSTRGSGFDTLLAIYTNAIPGLGLSLTNLALVAEDDDSGGFLTSEVVFNAVAGTDYAVLIKGYAKSSGKIVLGWTLEQTPQEVPRIFQQPVSQTVGSNDIASFSVTAFSALPLAYQWFFECHSLLGATNSLLVVSNVNVSHVGGYYVTISNEVRGITSLSGYLQLNLSDSTGPNRKAASHDKFADRLAGAGGTVNLQSQALTAVGFGSGAAPVRGFPQTQVFSTFGSTKEPGEPNHAGEPGGASAWYSLVAEDDGLLQVSTEGSDFDTVLAVYAGPENALGFDELSLIASDDNGGTDGQTSRVQFRAAKGQFYQVAVDGVRGVSGQVRLTYQITAVPNIAVQPTSQTVAPGGNARFEVTVTNVLSASYQWRFNGTPIVEATNSVLLVTNAQPVNVGRYSCLVTNSAGAATSLEVLLSVDASTALRFGAPTLSADRRLQLQLSGATAGAVIEASTNLLYWLPVFTNLDSSESFIFRDPYSTNLPGRFYRGKR